MEQVIGQFLGDLSAGILQIALAAFSAYILGQGMVFAKSFVTKIKDENLQKVINTSLDRLGDLVKLGVESTEVSVGRELRAMVSNGKIEKSELLKLKDVVRNEVLSGLDIKFKENVELGVGEINIYINQLIEKSLEEIKKEIV